MNKKHVEFLRKQFPIGTRIKLNHMEDPYHPVPAGTMGTLVHIDDMGTFHMEWDNGRTLGLIPGEDDFTVLPQLQTMKLYMPLNVTLYKQRDWYNDGEEYDENGTRVTGTDLFEYMAPISQALIDNLMPEELSCGLMRWYDERDSVYDKVRSVFFKVEPRNDELWGVAECEIQGTLAKEELDKLKEFIEGQASDGWGESLEQKDVDVPEGTLYVGLWSVDDDWSLLTEEERFGPTGKEKQPLDEIIRNAEARTEAADREEGELTLDR